MENQEKIKAELDKIHSLKVETEAEILEKENKISDLDYKIRYKQKELNKILKQLDDTQLENDFKDIFVRHFEEKITSSEINDKLSLLNLDEKDYIKTIMLYCIMDMKRENLILIPKLNKYYVLLILSVTISSVILLLEIMKLIIIK